MRSEKGRLGGRKKIDFCGVPALFAWGEPLRICVRLAPAHRPSVATESDLLFSTLPPPFQSLS